MAKPFLELNIEPTSLKRVLTRIRWDGRRAQQAGVRIVRETAIEIYDESQELVPVDFGNLKATGRVVEFQTQDPLKASYGVQYGSGPAGGKIVRGGESLPVPEVLGDAGVDYAAAVHELHPTKSKFVERPLQMALVRMRAKAAAALRVILRS